MPIQKENKKKSIKETFLNFSGSSKGSSYSILHVITAIFAIYLSFKCNGGFNFGGFLAACCCPHIYILYKIMTLKSCCRAMRR
jgi:hypothetical protein